MLAIHLLSSLEFMFPLSPVDLGILSWGVVELQHYLPTSIEMITVIPSLSIPRHCTTLVDLRMLHQSLPPWNAANLVMEWRFLSVLEFPFLELYWKLFSSVFIREAGLWFLSGCCVLLRAMLDLGGEGTLTSSRSVSWDSVRNIGIRFFTGLGKFGSRCIRFWALLFWEVFEIVVSVLIVRDLLAYFLIKSCVWKFIHFTYVFQLFWYICFQHIPNVLMNFIITCSYFLLFIPYLVNLSLLFVEFC